MVDFILRDRRGRDWHVKVRPIGGKLYFDDGWKRFGEDNYLEENDFLVFTRIENNVFKFKIHEFSSMCEKIKVMDEEEENNMMEDEEELDDDDNNEDHDDVDDGDVNMIDAYSKLCCVKTEQLKC
ncbi:B3 domain-containing protein [Trifolium pratense]|uniref:B3 domain-containing protein n=1 Tax=Trifolium pratense TaxID=57577 RepID=A0A2K3KCK7_TRIPR|nr:B3 domain-containing protein [Trifolium pratense]